MAIGDLNPAVWRIDIYEMKPESPFAGAITDLSNLYTSDLAITKQRNYPDEIRFTLDLQQLENRANNLNIASRDIIEPYKHKVRCYRNNKFVAQGIVIKTTVNLNNNSKNTIEVQCADTLTLLEKRLIHQDYGEGSWADFAKEVIMDAQHEPNRIYNYAWEGDGTSIDNAWFRGWRYLPGEETLQDYPEWEPNKLYSMYDTCTHDAKFWEAKEHAFYSGETWSSSNWTLLGILDEETGEVDAAYGVWREDNEEPGPTGTALGGWGGTSSCHMTSKTFSVNNGAGSTISMKDSTVSSTLTAPYPKDETAPKLPDAYQEVEYLQNTYGATSAGETGPYIDTGLNAKKYASRLKATFDFEILSTAGTTSWHTLMGVSEGSVSGTWQWSPQFHLAVNQASPSIFTLEYETTAAGTSNHGTVNGPARTTDRTTLVLDAVADIPTITVNDTTYTGDLTRSTGINYGPDANIFVFARNYATPEEVSGHRRGDYGMPMKLYSLVIEDSKRVLRNYVPCYRKTDNKPGLYDLQNGKFYPSSGTGTLTVGPDVEYPEWTNSDQLHTRVMVHGGEKPNYTITGATISTSDVFGSIDTDVFKQKLAETYPEIINNYDFVTSITAETE